MQEIIKEIAGIVMMLCFMLCYIPQIIKIFKNKSSRDVSLMLILMSIGGYIAGMVYMFLGTFGLWWFLNYCTGLIMCSILGYAWFKYKEDDEYDSY